MLKKVLLVVMIIVTLLWLGFIFSNSLDDGEVSSEKSAGVTETVNKVAQTVGIEKEISEGSVRNMAHFSEFLMLSVLIFTDLALTLTLLPPRSLYLQIITVFLSVPVCFLLACVDELLQKFSDGRAAQFSDVLLDTLGALCGAALSTCVYLAAYLIASRKKRRKQSADT